MSVLTVQRPAFGGYLVVLTPQQYADMPQGDSPYDRHANTPQRTAYVKGLANRPELEGTSSGGFFPLSNQRHGGGGVVYMSLPSQQDNASDNLAATLAEAEKIAARDMYIATGRDATEDERTSVWLELAQADPLASTRIIDLRG